MRYFGTAMRKRSFQPLRMLCETLNRVKENERARLFAFRGIFNVSVLICILFITFISDMCFNFVRIIIKANL